MQLAPPPIVMPPITEEPDEDSMFMLKFCGEHEFIGRWPLIAFRL